jgi:hypothetical protein
MPHSQITRVELLTALAELGALRTEWRLGQTLANVAMAAGRSDAGGVWDIEDDEALLAARDLLDQYARADLSGHENRTASHSN